MASAVRTNTDLSMSTMKMALCIAAQKGHTEVVRLLLEVPGIDVNANDGMPLVKACEKGRLDITRWLLLHGADVGARDNMALRLACKNCHLHIMRLLSIAGAKEEEGFDGNGENPKRASKSKRRRTSAV